MLFKDEQFVNKYIHWGNFTIVALITIYCHHSGLNHNLFKQNTYNLNTF